MRPDALLLFGPRLRSERAGLEQPRHVASQHPHRLQSFGILRRLAGQPSVHAVPVLRRDDRHVRDGEILVQPVERRTRPAPAANDHRCGGFVGQQFRTGVEDPVEQRAERSVRPGIIDGRSHDQPVRIAQGDAHLVVERIVEYAAPQVGALPAGDTSPHGFVPQLDDLRPYAFRFERPGHFGQGDEGIARMPRTSVYQQYFHGQLSLLIRRSSTARAALPGATPSDRPPKAPRS